MANAPKNAYDAKNKKRHWLDHAAVYAAAGAAVAAACAAGAGIFQATVAKDTEERQLRAYVGIVPHVMEHFGEPDQILRTTQKNHGMTPAIDVFVSPPRGEVLPINQPFGPYLCFPAPKVSNTFTLFPQQEFPYVIRGNNSISKQQVDLVRDGTQYQFTVWGVLHYKDVFGIQRCTRYCWGFKGSKMSENDIDFCLQHNDAY